MRNKAKPIDNHDRFNAYFFIGSSEYYITSHHYGFATYPGRYTRAAVDLDEYLIKEHLGTGVNDRIYFASFANSAEEFVSYLNLFFNLKFNTEPRFYH